jgi:hypothetical protein
MRGQGPLLIAMSLITPPLPLTHTTHIFSHSPSDSSLFHIFPNFSPFFLIFSCPFCVSLSQMRDSLSRKHTAGCCVSPVDTRTPICTLPLLSLKSSCVCPFSAAVCAVGRCCSCRDCWHQGRRSGGCGLLQLPEVTGAEDRVCCCCWEGGVEVAGAGREQLCCC